MVPRILSYSHPHLALWFFSSTHPQTASLPLSKTSSLSSVVFSPSGKSILSYFPYLAIEYSLYLLPLPYTGLFPEDSPFTAVLLNEGTQHQRGPWNQRSFHSSRPADHSSFAVSNLCYCHYLRTSCCSFNLKFFLRFGHLAHILSFHKMVTLTLLQSLLQAWSRIHCPILFMLSR